MNATSLNTLPPQFVRFHSNYKGNGSNYKLHIVPCNVVGKKIDPGDPANWLTYEEASKDVSNPFGFMVTERDPYFVIEIDQCYGPEPVIIHSLALPTPPEPEPRQLTPEVRAMLERFPNAAVAPSKRGRGLYIVGRCDKAKFEEAHYRLGNGIEIFTHERFIASDFRKWRGDPNHDCTDALLDLVRTAPRSVTPGRVDATVTDPQGFHAWLEHYAPGGTIEYDHYVGPDPKHPEVSTKLRVDLCTGAWNHFAIPDEPGGESPRTLLLYL